MRKHRLAAVVAAAGIVLSVAACASSGPSAPSGTSQESNTSNQDLNTYEQAQPAPHFNYSVIRQELTSIEASQALGENTTSFFFGGGAIGKGNGPIFSCPSVGQPVANTAELTNPQKVVEDQNVGQYGTGLTIGNIDPNGIYPPTNSTGTNVMCRNSKGADYLVYWEGFVMAVNGSAYWDAATGQVVPTGAVNMPSCQTTTVKGKPQEVCTK